MLRTKKIYFYHKIARREKKIRPKLRHGFFFRLDHFRTQQSRTFFRRKINVDDRIYVTHSTTPTKIKYMERVSCNNKVSNKREYNMDGNPVSIFLIHFLEYHFTEIIPCRNLLFLIRHENIGSTHKVISSHLIPFK